MEIKADLVETISTFHSISFNFNDIKLMILQLEIIYIQISLLFIIST